MSELARGSVVMSVAGRDKGHLMCVVEVLKNGVLVCDGKERKLLKPKLKKPKHIKASEGKLSEEMMVSDKTIKKALKLFLEA